MLYIYKITCLNLLKMIIRFYQLFFYDDKINVTPVILMSTRWIDCCLQCFCFWLKWSQLITQLNNSSAIKSSMDLVFILISLICCGVACIFLMRNHRRPTSLFESDTRNRRVLFVIAHPDDECMFFAPTILALSHCGQYDVFLLCLSSGDFFVDSFHIYKHTKYL